MNDEQMSKYRELRDKSKLTKKEKVELAQLQELVDLIANPPSLGIKI